MADETKTDDHQLLGAKGIEELLKGIARCRTPMPDEQLRQIREWCDLSRLVNPVAFSKTGFVVIPHLIGEIERLKEENELQAMEIRGARKMMGILPIEDVTK